MISVYFLFFCLSPVFFFSHLISHALQTICGKMILQVNISVWKPLYAMTVDI